MLMQTPRALSRGKWSQKSAPPPRRKQRVAFQLSEKKYQELVKLLTPFMRNAEPTPFAEEGPRRTKLRSKLCLEGWPWSDADQQAGAVVHTALHRVGAQRPRWIEGQQEYCDNGFLRDDLCWTCGQPLPKYRKKYCCHRCVHVANQSRIHSMFDLFI